MELEKEKDEEEKKPVMKTEEEIGNDDESDTEKISENDVKEEDQEMEEDEEEEEILPPPVVELKELHSIPDFAVVCSFFNKFSLMGNLRHLSFGKLETLFTTYDNNKVPRELIDLHVFLLRRLKYQHATVDNWEKYLRKCLASDPNTVEELTHIERYGGYAYISIADKIQILKTLCELQIESNAKFREAIMQTCRNVDLRLIPVGTDRYGLSYWYQQDNECTMRLYTEEADDHCGSTWTLAAKTHDELKTLIENLEKDDLGYDKSLDPLEKRKLTDIQKGKIPVGHTDKKGTYLDTYIDQSSVQQLKDEVLKKKTERNNRKAGTHTKVRKFVEDEPEEEEIEEEKPKVEDEQEEEKEEVEIPEELLEGRRPRRGASIKAASNLKKVLGVGTTPKRTPKRPTEKKPSVEPSEHEDEEEEEDNEDEDEDESEEEQEDSGDEFRPKSDKKKSKKKRVKKRKATPTDSDDEDDESEDEEIVQKERKVATGDAACGKCKTSKDWEVLLLCDCCDDAWHTYCLKPVLWFVPDGDWFCPKCKHGRLINRLKEVEERLDADLKQKAIDDKKKQAAAERLRREMEHIGVNLNNIIQTQQILMPPQRQSSSSESDDDGTQRKCKRKAVKKMSNWNKPKPQNVTPVYVGGRRSCRNTTKVDYKGSEFDQMINEAVENIDGAPPREVKPPKEPELDENGVPIPKAPRGKKRARLNDLDAVVDSDGSNNYEEEQEETPSEEEEEEAEVDSGSDFEDELPKTSKHRSRRSNTGGRRGGGGKGRGRRNRSWSGSSTEEEEDDWIASDSDDGYSNKRKRKIKYESEPEEEDENVEKSTTGRPLRKAVKSSDKKIVISDDDSDAENGEPVPKKKAKKGTSDDEFEVENDNEGEEEDEEEEEEEMDEDNDEEDDEEDDDSEKDSNDSELPREVKRMAGAPPSQQLPVRPVRPQISAKRPRIKPDAKKEKTPESDENDDEEEVVPTKKPAVSLQNSLWTPGNLPDNFQPIIANPYLRPAETISPSKNASNAAEQIALPVSNPYANVSQKKDDLDTKPSGAANYLAL